MKREIFWGIGIAVLASVIICPWTAAAEVQSTVQTVLMTGDTPMYNPKALCRPY